MAKTKTIIGKEFLKDHYNFEFEKLKELFDDDWYLYKDGVEYCLVIGNVELSFISLKWDFNGIVNGIATGFLLGKMKK